MTSCPHSTLLHLDNFTQGTPRERIAQLRQTHRIVWQEDDYANGGHWLVLQRDDIDTILRTPAQFTNNFGPLLEDTPPEVLPELQKSMTFQDPPRHRSFRGLADYAFRPDAIEARKPLMREMARQIIDAIVDRGHCEFIADVAMQLPMRVMFTTLGVRDQDYQRVVDLTNTLSLASDPDYADTREAGFIAGLELIEYGASLAADHRDNPRDTLTMAVLAAELEGEKLDDQAFGRLFQNLIVGGIETTRNTLGALVDEFINNPDQYQQLQNDLGLIPNAVEEILRLRNTVVYLRRTATSDFEFAGEQIKKGDKLVAILGSANRDPQYFDNPNRFDISRDKDQTRRNIRTFGNGPHFCIGHLQARMNLAVMTEEIVTRLSNLRYTGEPVHFKSNFMDGFKKMPIAFDLRKNL